MLLYAALFFTTYMANPKKAMQDFSGRFGFATNTVLYMVEAITTYYIMIFHVLLPLLCRQRKRNALAVAFVFYIVKLFLSYWIWSIEPRPESGVVSTTIIPEDSVYWFFMWYNIFYLFDTILSLSVALMVAWLHRGKQQIILEKQKAEAELSALKHQINPHFLFNSLSFIYSKIIRFDEETADSVLILANIMRYALGKNLDSNGLVNIMEEVKHIENVIEINQRRHSHRLHIHYEEEIANLSVSIVPLLLITFVENAFKHGDPHDKEQPIIIHLCTNDHELTFFIKNKKSTGAKELSNGIGLKNINKQLQLMYDEDFTMQVEDNVSTFSVLLKIPLRL